MPTDVMNVGAMVMIIITILKLVKMSRLVMTVPVMIIGRMNDDRRL